MHPSGAISKHQLCLMTFSLVPIHKHTHTHNNGNHSLFSALVNSQHIMTMNIPRGNLFHINFHTFHNAADYRDSFSSRRTLLNLCHIIINYICYCHCKIYLTKSSFISLCDFIVATFETWRNNLFSCSREVFLLECGKAGFLRGLLLDAKLVV